MSTLGEQDAAGISVAVVTATGMREWDEDLPAIEAAFTRRGCVVQIACWDDPAVDWHAFDIVVIRSTWDYTSRLEEFLGWVDFASQAARLVNPADVVRWNADKR